MTMHPDAEKAARETAKRLGLHPARGTETIQQTAQRLAVDLHSPFTGKKPVVGDRVYIDFGDSVNAHPEVEGIVRFIDDTHIAVGEKRFRLDQCVSIETL